MLRLRHARWRTDDLIIAMLLQPLRDLVLRKLRDCFPDSRAAPQAAARQESQSRVLRISSFFVAWVSNP